MLTQIQTLIQSTQGIALLISSLLMTVAFIVFLLAVIFYINKRRAGDGDGFKQAGNMLLGSVFALFVMVAVWGMVYFLSNALGIGIGGCTSRPSTLPGVANNVDCGTGTSGVRSGSSGSGSTGGAARTMPRSGSSGSSGYSDDQEVVLPRQTNSTSCVNGPAHNDAGGRLLYCDNALLGESCIMGSCREGLSCYILDPTYSRYGTCQ